VAEAASNLWQIVQLKLFWRAIYSGIKCEIIIVIIIIIIIIINGSRALCLALAVFTVPWFYTQLVGLLWWGISRSQDRYLRTWQHRHKINKDIHISSGIRNDDPNVWTREDSSCLRCEATVIDIMRCSRMKINRRCEGTCRLQFHGRAVSQARSQHGAGNFRGLNIVNKWHFVLQIYALVHFSSLFVTYIR
jgi:hypothetical protein